jgi:hypothetical protein
MSRFFLPEVKKSLLDYQAGFLLRAPSMGAI